jgi:hypothetical protein
MPVRYLLVLSAFLLALGSCRQPATLSEQAGFELTIPQGWQISEQEVYPDSLGYYAAIEKTGATESGIFTITWIADGSTPTELLDTYFAGMLESGLIEPGDLFRDPLQTTDFNGVGAQKITYNALVMGLEHRGTTWAFPCGERTYLLVFQEAIEDIQKNQAGYSVLRQSFQCR